MRIHRVKANVLNAWSTDRPIFEELEEILDGSGLILINGCYMTAV